MGWSGWVEVGQPSPTDVADVPRRLDRHLYWLDCVGDNDVWGDGAGVTVTVTDDGWVVRGHGVELMDRWGGATQVNDAVAHVRAQGGA